jgi:hypothetical protein
MVRANKLSRFNGNVQRRSEERWAEEPVLEKFALKLGVETFP